MQTVVVDDLEVELVFPGGVSLMLGLAGKSVDVRARFKDRPVLVRSEVVARPSLTIDLIETRGPEE